jgi:Cu-Zn family superoxide dismutase
MLVLCVILGGSLIAKEPPVIYATVALQFFLLASAAPEQQPVQTATAAMKDVEGKQIGTATLTESGEGIRISLDVSKLPAGAHGIHIHSVGKCDPPDFKSAGPHFNPDGKKHGMKNPDGPHAGDLSNIEVGADGTVKTSVTTKLVTLGAGKNSLFPEGGTALVIHADPDDEKTDPAGNSGARIACGVITQYVKTAEMK